MEMTDEQIIAWRKLRNGNILKGSTGLGKSRVALAYFFVTVCCGEISVNGEGVRQEPTRPRDLYIITPAKKRDTLEWESELAYFLLGRDSEENLGHIRVTVDSWNNISKYNGVRDAFYIFDEQRLVGKGAWVKSFLRIAEKNQWIMLSATPGDTWLDYIPVFIANGFYRNRTHFLREHVVFKRNPRYPVVERFVGENILDAHRREILVEMQNRRHTTRHINSIWVEYDKTAFYLAWKKRIDVFNDDEPIKDAGEWIRVLRKVVNSSPSRLGAVMEVMEKNPRVIIFYNFDYELAMLRTLSDICDVVYGEWNGHRHDPLPDSQRWIYCVQYSAGAEGWNCITTDCIVFYSLTYSYRQFVQAQGRIDRMNTSYENLFYYVLQSDSFIDKAILRSLSAKKDFNERDFLSEMG